MCGGVCTVWQPEWAVVVVMRCVGGMNGVRAMVSWAMLFVVVMAVCRDVVDVCGGGCLG